MKKNTERDNLHTIIDFQREREARVHTKEPTMFQKAVVKLAELDTLISETKHPAGEFLTMLYGNLEKLMDEFMDTMKEG